MTILSDGSEVSDASPFRRDTEMRPAPAASSPEPALQPSGRRSPSLPSNLVASQTPRPISKQSRCQRSLTSGLLRKSLRDRSVSEETTVRRWKRTRKVFPSVSGVSKGHARKGYIQVANEMSLPARSVSKGCSLADAAGWPKSYRESDTHLFSYFIKISSRGTPAMASKPPDRITSASLLTSRK